MIITAPDSSFMEDQKCVLVNHGLFVVQVDTALFTNVVGMAIITALPIYRKKYVEQITVDLLDLTLRLLSHIYGAPILGVSRSHTTTQHSR